MPRLNDVGSSLLKCLNSDLESNDAEAVDPKPDDPPGARRPWLDFRGYINNDVMRLYATKQLTQRANITCFRCGEQGHYRAECLSWKTKICFHHPRFHGCREGESCSYAHNYAELRSPWYSKCVRVIKRQGQIYTLGCQSDKHTFKLCPHMRCVVCRSRKHWGVRQLLPASDVGCYGSISKIKYDWTADCAHESQ